MAPQNRIRQAVGLLDLTSLDGNETEEKIDELCRRARTPLDPVAAACTWAPFVGTARRAAAETAAIVTGSDGRLKTSTGKTPVSATPEAARSLNVTIAGREPEIEPDRVSNDLGWEAMTGVRDGLHAPCLTEPLSSGQPST